MADFIRVMLEIGPKGKRVVAVAVDWPGLERGAKNEGLQSNAFTKLYANTICKLISFGLILGGV